MRSSASFRPHFSIDVQTTSSEGLLLHISGKHGVPLVILYLDEGKVKLSVGEDEIVSSQRINDGDWHSVCSKLTQTYIPVTAKSQVLVHVFEILCVQIKFTVKKRLSHLAVDSVRAPNGQPLKGFTHDLESPVYVGQLRTLHQTYV